jgi:hypothetical protein
MEAERAKALRLIRRNIDEHGFHIYVVSGGPLPRYAYTIGLRDPSERSSYSRVHFSIRLPRT